MKDLIIGVSDGYDWNVIKYWVNSIRRCGFGGSAALVALNCDKATLARVGESGINVLMSDVDAQGNAVHRSEVPVIVERFFHVSNALSELQEHRPRYVIATDVRDVVFQTDPSRAIDQLVNESWNGTGGPPNLIAASEGLAYKDEPWGDKNFYNTFGPHLHDLHRDHTIYNAGTIAGTYGGVKDLAMVIFQMSLNRAIRNPDQAVYNFLLQQSPYRATTLFADPDSSAWACQGGTLMDPSKMAQFRPKLLCAEPLFDFEDGYVKTSSGRAYCLFHQWDRTPFKDAIMQKYG
ncbi:MAG: hypothetical protein JO128_19700 [Alphaproteobacteria bacterium]|nr:hypothetical protein [Alphaproteobacteria bacterium]